MPETIGACTQYVHREQIVWNVVGQPSEGMLSLMYLLSKNQLTVAE